MFDTLGRASTTDDSHWFTTEDVLALCLLDIRPRPGAVRRLMSGDMDRCLIDLTTERTIWQMTDKDHAAMTNAWDDLRTLDNFGRTAVSKLLARKRPGLVPIRDSVIERVLGIGDRPWWGPLGGVLQDKALRDSIDHLWTGPDEDRPTTLRLLDVAAWMLGSRSTPVARIRQRIGSTGMSAARTGQTGRADDYQEGTG